MPLGFADPLSVAVVEVTGVAASVVTVGVAGAANDSSEPYAMPCEFEAIAQK